MKKKRNKVYWLLGLMTLCCVCGIFAYWTQELTVHNEFKTARYDTNIKEKFVSPKDWKPGEEINKDVWISNKGSIPVFVKVVLHQEWIRRENVTDLDGNIILPKAGDKFPLSFETQEGRKYAAEIAWGSDVVLLASGKKGDINLGLKTVEHIAQANGKWLLVSDIPDQNGDYLLYYIGYVKPNEKSPLIVDSVTMNSLIQPAVIRKDTYYDKSIQKWKTVEQKNNTNDYECAKYTMLITATTVQATSDAIKDVFAKENDHAKIVKYLADHAINPTNL